MFKNLVQIGSVMRTVFAKSEDETTKLISLVI